MTNKENQTSLTIKTDEKNKAVPLGIKSTVQGIEHFTNWDNIANSIDEMGGRLRREDSFKNNKRVLFAHDRRFFPSDSVPSNNPNPETFDDVWDINKIQIIDDLAFVGEDQYTDVEKLTSSEISANGYQYYVARNFERNVTIIDEEDDSDDVPGYASWTASGNWTTTQPIELGVLDPDDISGSIGITYIPTTSTWTLSATVPSSGGWGGDITGTKVQDVCSGGGSTNVDIPITGTHYCTTSGAQTEYSGIVRLTITAASAADPATCAAALGSLSLSFGTPTQYQTASLCFIGFTYLSSAYTGFTPAETSDVSENIKITLAHPVGSYTVKLNDNDLNILQEHVLVGDKTQQQGYDDEYKNANSSEEDTGENKEAYLNPTLGDFSHVYIKTLAGNYFKFGGFLNNDFSKSNAWVKRDTDNCHPKPSDFDVDSILYDPITLAPGQPATMIDEALSHVSTCFKCADENNPDTSVKCKEKEAFGRATEFTGGGLKTGPKFGGFLPPEEGQLNNFFPCNYSQLRGRSAPSWNDVINEKDHASSLKQKELLFALGRITVQNLDDPNFGFSGPGYTNMFGDYCNTKIPYNSIQNPSDFKNPETFGGSASPRNGLESKSPVPKSRIVHTRVGLDDSNSESKHLSRFTQDTPLGSAGRREAMAEDIPNKPVVESEIGFYYLVVDDSNQDRPFIAAVQFDFTILEGVEDGIDEDTGKNPYGGDLGLSDFQKGLRYLESDIQFQFIKLLPIRKCGKIDIYKRVAGGVGFTYLGEGKYSYANHDLVSGDFIRVSGALYKETGAAIRDTHPLNGIFKVSVIDENTFRFLPGGREENFFEGQLSDFAEWDNPPSLADMALLRSMDGVSFERFGNNFQNVGGQREGEGWSYQGTMFSPTGKNGYIKGLFNVENDAQADNRLAEEDEFYTTNKIDVENLRTVEVYSGKHQYPTPHHLWDDGYINLKVISGGRPDANDNSDFSKTAWGAGSSRGWWHGGAEGVGSGSYTGKFAANLILSQTLEAIPETSSPICSSNNLHETRNLALGPHQIYPYISNNSATNFGRSVNYCGCMFGCDFKIQRSEDSGSNKVYTIVVGERGSDVSVDLFGSTEETGWTSNDKIFFHGARRQIPEYLPYGKTHLINITVDSSNNISSVDHKNTLFGGGNSIKTLMNENIVSGDSAYALEKNPWYDLEASLRIDKGLESLSRASSISKYDILLSEQDFLDKNYLTDRSRYWQRHAVAHWYPQPMPEILNFRYGRDDYPEGNAEGDGIRLVDGIWVKSMYQKSSIDSDRVVPAGGSPANPDNQSTHWIGRRQYSTVSELGNFPFKRTFGSIRRPMIDGTGFRQYVSIFGDDKNIISIDRFNFYNKRVNEGYWSIFPWVDSFGKSVAISIDSNLQDRTNYANGPKMTVLSASTSRCNIDITDEVQQPIANLTKDQIRPGDSKYRTHDSESQIGQLNAHFVFSGGGGYNTLDYMQINAGGSMGGRDRKGLSRKYKRRRIFDQTDQSSIRYTPMPKGSFAGHGIAEVMTSCHMSYSDIVFDKDRIIFSEQSLGNNESTIYVFDFNASSTLPFKRNHTIVRPFNFERNSEFTTDENKVFLVSKIGTTSPPLDISTESYRKVTDALALNVFNVGDGFGLNIKADKDLLLTNATDTHDEFGQPIAPQIGGHFANLIYGIDQIFVYEKFSNSPVFEFSQKITATTTEKFDLVKAIKDIYGPIPGGVGIGAYLRRVDPEALINIVCPLAAMNYDNVPNGTFAWNVRLAGRYDLVGTKIVLQDPTSVAVFDRDFSESEPMIGVPFALNPELTSSKIETFDHQDTSKLTYAAVTGSRTRSGTVKNLYDCRLNIEDYSKSQGKYHELPEQVPVLNYDLEGNEDVYISSMKIKFGLIAGMHDISTSFTPSVDRASNKPLVPKVVLYTRDPEGIVTRNTSSKIITDATNISNFYTLDTSYQTKKRGGFIAPTKSASDFDSPTIEGDTFYNEVNATRDHRDAGFMGQFRGGAQDLFFYGALPEGTPENAQEVFGGNEPRATLPYLYGGRTNLADFTGGCSWIAPDVYHKYTQDQISQIKPYAKLFNPVREADGTYSVTITSDDINFQEYTSKDTGGIWLGFVLTNIKSFDINTSEIMYEEFRDPGSDILFYPNYHPVETYTKAEAGAGAAADSNIGPFRYIAAASIGGVASPERGFIKTVTANWPNARYPYCRVGVYPAQSQGKGSQTQIRKIEQKIGNQGRGSEAKSLACFAEATVKSPEIEIKGFVTTGRRYKTSFYKKAIVSLKDIFTQATFDGLPSAVVAIGSSSTSESSSSSDIGGFEKSYQIVTATDGYIYNPYSNYYSNRGIFKAELSHVDQYVQPGLRHSNILSSFDVQEPEYLSLTIKGLFLEENFTTLFTPTASEPASDFTSLFLAPAQDSSDTATTLFTGLRDFDGVEPLFLRADIAENKFTLNINEIEPSAVLPFFMRTIDASGGMDLAFAPPTTGSAPLFVTGPIAASGFTSLNVPGGAPMDEIATLRVSGAFQSSNLAPLFIHSHLDASGLVSLAMNPPMTGSMPLYLNSNPVVSGQATLTIFDKASGVQGLNLFTGTQYDIDNKDLNLFINIVDPEFNQASLYVDGLSFDADSNRDSSSSLLTGLPDGEFDKGDPNGDFNEDLITRTISSKTYSSNSVLANAIDEEFYEYNKKIMKSRNFRPRLTTSGKTISTSSQTDPYSPYIFANQRQGLTRYAPYDDKKGTLDPAYNLAIGVLSSSDRDTTVFPLSGEDSKIPPYGTNLSRDYVDKYFTGDGSGSTGKESTFRQDSIEKEFYDLNEDILVTGALKGDNDMIEISIYDIDEDGNVSQRGEGGVDGIIRTSPADMVLGEDGKVKQGVLVGGNGPSDFMTDSNVALQMNNYGVISPVPISVSYSDENKPNPKNISASLTDPFTSLREKMFKLVVKDIRLPNREGAITNAVFNGSKVEILSLKVSENNKCAISFRVKFDYTFYAYRRRQDGGGYIKGKGRKTTHYYTKSDNFVLIFDINKFNGKSGFSSEKDYSLIGRPSTYNPFSHTSISFDSDDNIYTNGGRYGIVNAYNISENYKDYQTLINLAVSFKDSSDYKEYANYNNNRYFKNRNYGGVNLTGFGHKVKIYKEYESEKQIMVVSAPLFDPFVLGGLSASTGTHYLNPMGAAYIYKKGKDEDSWSYHGAVYAKGFTSANIASNISQFRGGTIGPAAGKPQVSLFGYDFDYNKGILSVTAPGGDGAGTVEAGKVYSFDISSTPTLTNTYSASNISVDSSPIRDGDNFGSYIVSFGDENIFTFSDASLKYLKKRRENLIGSSAWMPQYGSIRNEGQSLLHNLSNNSSFGFGGASDYSRENTLRELRPYFTSKLKSGAYPESSSVMQVWSRILSIKKMSTKNKDRLLVVRKFAFRLNSAGMSSDEHYDNSFDVVKLQVLDLERSANGTLFIKAANQTIATTPLLTLAPGPSGGFDLAIKPIDFASGSPTLFVDNRNFATDMSLHTPHADADGNVFLPLALSGFAPGAANQGKLFLKHQYSIATPDLFMPAIGVENSDISLLTQGSAGEGLSDNTSLVINRHIDITFQPSASTLFLNQKNFASTSLFSSNAGSDNPTVDLVIGTFSIASGVNKVPLSIKTFTPPTGPGGGYVGSGVISITMSGNNDGDVYYKGAGDTTLFMPARNIDNLGGPLFIEKSFGGNSPLYIDSRIASGDAPLYVDGAQISNVNTTLSMRGGTALIGLAETGNFNIFTRGFFD